MEGIDTPAKRFVVLFKLNFLTNDGPTARAALEALHRALTGGTSGSRSLDYGSFSVLVGFSARFFKGQLTPGRNTVTGAPRFGLKCPCPRDLKEMHAVGDFRFPQVGTRAALASLESDLLLIVEADDASTSSSICSVVDDVVSEHPIEIRARHGGFQPDDGVGYFGFKECVSNLQFLKERSPEEYRRHVYVHDADAGSSRYDGGTYVVFRKYVQDTARWFSDAFTVEVASGECLAGRSARQRAVGRSEVTGLVVDDATGLDLDALPDEAQVSRAPRTSHIRKANPRGQGLNTFGQTVGVRNARLLRRGFSFSETGEQGNSPCRGLLFLCFQSNITRTGFEFIHNEWLMSSFLGGKDCLLNPDTGVVEPVDGCYYFVPRVGAFFGDVFFGDFR